MNTGEAYNKDYASSVRTFGGLSRVKPKAPIKIGGE